MKKNQNYIKAIFLLVILVLVASCNKNKDYQTAKELIQAMKVKNDGEWFQHFTFKQHTLQFDPEGKQIDSIVWYESVSYPYLFRIDRNIENETYTIYRNDSTYNFRNDSLVNMSNKPSAHLVFKGGLYFISVDETLSKLQKYGYDTNVFRKDEFKGEPAYVIGEEDNQIWLHVKNYYCMRRIYATNNNNIVDVVYEDFKKLGKGFVEQKVTFYVEGKKRLEEFYFDIKLKDYIDPKVYDVKTNYKWYLEY